MTRPTNFDALFLVNLPLVAAAGVDAHYDWQATPEQRAALAVRFECIEILSFGVDARIMPLRKDGHFRVSGMVFARVVQNCVVSLEPVVSDVETALDLLLFPEGESESAETEIADEEFECYSDKMLDLGEIGAIELALTLDPYPRAPDVSVADSGPGGRYGVHEEEQGGRHKPFEALAALKRKS